MVSEPDYVTVLPTNNPRLFLVAVMTYHSDDYAIKRCSEQALPKDRANSLAKCWAAAIGAEVR